MNAKVQNIETHVGKFLECEYKIFKKDFYYCNSVAMYTWLKNISIEHPERLVTVETCDQSDEGKRFVTSSTFDHSDEEA